MAILADILVGLIGAGGSLAAGSIQDRGARRQNNILMNLTREANQTQNAQWEKEFGLNERKQDEDERINKLNQLKAVFASQPELRKSAIQIWAGRAA